MIQLIFFLLANTEANEPISSLEIQGTPGVEVFGVCFSKEGESRKFSETSPSEIDFDIRIEKCKLEKSNASAPLKIRLFQNRQLTLDKDFIGPSSGIEIVIPLP